VDINPTAVPSSPGSLDLRAEPAPAPGPKRRRNFRERIVNGLLLALPLLLTLWILAWLYSILDHNVIEPLAGLILWKLKWTTASTELPYWFEAFVAPILAIALALLLLYYLDRLSDTGLHKGIDYALKRVPVLSHIYGPIQQIVQSLDQGPEQRSAFRMVLITFPHPGIKLPAFVTGSCRDVNTGKVILSVYVPTTPIPTSGFFLLVPEDEVTELNWNTEQTLQAVVSGGLTCPREVSYSPDKAHPNKNSQQPLVPSEAPNRPQDG
jgi:uncharacterized membrane protein